MHGACGRVRSKLQEKRLTGQKDKEERRVSGVKRAISNVWYFVIAI